MTAKTYDVKKIEDSLASFGAYLDRKNAGKRAETHLKRFGDYLDSNPLALIESSYARMKKRKISSTEVDGLRKKLQAAYKQIDIMPLIHIEPFYTQRGLRFNKATYRQDLYDKCVEMARELKDLKANSAETALTNLLNEYSPLTWDAEIPVVVSKAYVAPTALKAPVVKRKITAELKENLERRDNLERKVASTFSPKASRNQTQNAAFSMYAGKYGLKDEATAPALARPHAKKKSFWGKMASLTTYFLASTLGTVIGYNLPAPEQTNLPVDNSPGISVEYHSMPAVGKTNASKPAPKKAAEPVKTVKQSIAVDNGNKRVVQKITTASSPQVHTVPVTIEKGDTINNLCNYDATCIQKVFRLNPGKNLDKIFPGDRINFP